MLFSPRSSVKSSASSIRSQPPLRPAWSMRQVLRLSRAAIVESLCRTTLTFWATSAQERSLICIIPTRTGEWVWSSPTPPSVSPEKRAEPLSGSSSRNASLRMCRATNIDKCDGWLGRKRSEMCADLRANPTGSNMVPTQAPRESSHLVLQWPRIEIANSTHAPNSLGAIVLRTKLAAKVADMEVDASIERGELPVKNIFNECLTGQNLSWRFEERA